MTEKSAPVEFQPFNLANVVQPTQTMLFGLRNRMMGIADKFFQNQTVIGGTARELTIVIPHHKQSGLHHEIYFYDFAESRAPIAWISHAGNEVTLVYSEKDHVVKIHYTQEMLCEALAVLHNTLWQDKMGNLPFRQL